MISGDENIGREFEDAFDSFEFELDEANMQRAFDMLDASAKRKNFRKKFAIGTGFAALVFSVSLFFYSQEDVNVVVTDNTIETQTNLIDLKSDEVVISTKDVNITKEKTEKNNSASIIEEPIRETLNEESNNKIVVAETVVTESSALINDNNRAEEKIINEEIIKAEEYVEIEQEIISTEEIIEEEVEFVEAVEQKMTFTEESESNGIVEEPIVAEEEVVVKSVAVEANIVEATEIEAILVDSSELVIEMDSLEYDLDSLDDRNIIHVTEEVKQKHLSFSADVVSGIAYVNPGLALKSGQLADAEWDRRSNEEGNLTTYNYGVNLNMKYKGFTLGTGLHLTEVGENIDYSPEYTKWGELVDLSHWERQDSIRKIRIRLPNGTQEILTLRFPDSVWKDTSARVFHTVIDSTITLANGNTSIKFFSVPLTLGYSFPWKKGEIYANAGVSLNWLNNAKGYYVDELSPERIMDLSNNTTYFRKFNWSGLVRLGMTYQVTNRWSVLLEGNSTIGLSPVTSTTTKFDQFYNTFGGVIGLRFQM